MTPTREIKIQAKEFTCPLCGGFRWGSSRLNDGTLMRSCNERIKLPDESLGYCRFTWHQDADHLFLRMPSDEQPALLELRTWHLLGITSEQAAFIRVLQAELHSIEQAELTPGLWSNHLKAIAETLCCSNPPAWKTFQRLAARLAAYGVLLTRDARRENAEPEVNDHG